MKPPTPRSTLVLTRAEMAALLDAPMALEAVEEAFIAEATGTGSMPSKVYIELDDHQGDFRAMPARMGGSVGLKWINAHPHNPERFGLPAVIGVYILSDPATAWPLAIMDATELTSWRTGAAAALGSRALGRSGARSLGIIGCGAQARAVIACHRAALGELEVLVADRSREAADSVAADTGANVVSVEEAAGCDLLCTLTPSREPIVRREWVNDGVHINAMGADAHGKQELDPGILTGGRIFVDAMEQGTASGEVNVPLHTGALSVSDIQGTLGQVLAGRTPGRDGARVTIFDSTGLALQDVSLARRAWRTAVDSGVGTALPLVG